MACGGDHLTPACCVTVYSPHRLQAPSLYTLKTLQLCSLTMRAFSTLRVHTHVERYSPGNIYSLPSVLSPHRINPTEPSCLRRASFSLQRPQGSTGPGSMHLLSLCPVPGMVPNQSTQVHDAGSQVHKRIRRKKCWNGESRK